MPTAAAEPIDVRYDLRGRERDAERGDPEVVAAQTQDRHAQDEREGGADDRGANDGHENVLLVPVLP